jgi:hypothetical protein
MYAQFRMLPGEPELRDDEVGVRIATPGFFQDARGQHWLLHGVFRVPAPPAGKPPQSAIRRIVVAVQLSQDTHPGNNNMQAHLAFLDERLEAHRVQKRGGFVSGSFHLDLLKLPPRFDPAGYRSWWKNEWGPCRPYRAFISASIGAHVSKVITYQVTAPELFGTKYPQRRVLERSAG